MMYKEITNIKKNGHLVAIGHGWQFWVKDNILYSINVEGTNYCIWCGLDRLNAHFRHLYKVLGKKHWTEDAEMVLIDKEFVKSYSWA